jgi:hypothetical protein
MQSGMTGKPAVDTTELESWIKADDLKLAPSLMNDYKDLVTVLPGNPYYDANAQRYVMAWKKYWGSYIPQLMATKRVPDAVPWGSYPTLAASVTSNASQVYNVMVHPFSGSSFKGVMFLCSEQMFAKDQGAHFGGEMSALANSWKTRFGGTDPHFFYTVPSKALAPKITAPSDIKGKHAAYEMSQWLYTYDPKTRKTVASKELAKFLDVTVKSIYK